MPAPFLKDVFFLPLYRFSSFVKNQLFIGLRINIRNFDLIPLVDISVFLPIPSSFHYCSSVIEFEVRDGNFSGSTFIVYDCFGYPGFSLYILEIRPLSDVGLVKTFSHSVRCLFVLMTVSFALQKLLSFRRSH